MKEKLEAISKMSKEKIAEIKDSQALNDFKVLSAYFVVFSVFTAPLVSTEKPASTEQTISLH